MSGGGDIGDIQDGPVPETVPVEVELSSALYAELAAALHGEPETTVSVGMLITMMLEEVWTDLQNSKTDPAWFECVKQRVQAARVAKQDPCLSGYGRYPLHVE